VRRWLAGDPTQPPPPAVRRRGRNSGWQHLDAFEVLSMPDAWEYPWFAAWDLAFHTIPLARLDPAFAKQQLDVLTREWYLHPNGQLPAYEWAFGDVNPPVHAWATWRVFQIDREQRGDAGDLVFLERVFHKLLLNFTWWVNRKDSDGRNIFQGGFLGLDNIGLFDRSAPLPTGGHMHQSDGTSWMAMYSLNLLQISLELALHNPVYQDIATKFFEHFLAIAHAMTDMGGDGVGLWDEEDEFFYDELHLPDGKHVPLKVRSMVGLIPLFAVEVMEHSCLDELPEFARRLNWFLEQRPDLATLVSRWYEPGTGERHLLSLLRGHRMKRLLTRLLDETEFLAPHGVRALSRYHLDHPYSLTINGGATHTVQYEPG
ncbi:MAG: glucosidase, partial [Gemmatimonadetes bacterium HGW-Gemmatimonadetes-1]